MESDRPRGKVTMLSNTAETTIPKTDEGEINDSKGISWWQYGKFSKPFEIEQLTNIHENTGTDPDSTIVMAANMQTKQIIKEDDGTLSIEVYDGNKGETIWLSADNVILPEDKKNRKQNLQLEYDIQDGLLEILEILPQYLINHLKMEKMMQKLFVSIKHKQ